MGDKGRRWSSAPKNYGVLWNDLETKYKGLSNENLHTLLKAILTATSQLERPVAAFTIRRLRLLEKIITSEHSQLVLYVVCTLVHLACSFVEKHEDVVNSGLVSPLCDAIEWAKGDFNDTTAGKIRQQILEIAVWTILQLSSGSVKTHDALHAEKIVQRLYRLVNPKTSPLFIKSSHKKGLPELLENKNLVAKCLKLEQKDVQKMSDAFYRTVSPDVKPNCLFKPTSGYITTLYESRDEHSHVAWDLAATGTVWVSHEQLESDEWIDIRPTAFVSSRVFWAQIGANAQQEHEKISQHLRNFQEKVYIKCRPTVGAFVGYHRKLTDIYHRCQVIESDSIGEDCVKVLCLDTGRVFHVLRTEELFLLLPGMKLKQFPILAVICKLHGVMSPPIAPDVIEKALTALCNLATVADRLELFAGLDAHVGLMSLSRCGQFSVMWRAMRVLSNVAHSPPMRAVLQGSDATSYVLGLCKKYPDMASQQKTDVRSLLQAALRMLGNLMWEFEPAKAQFAQLRGVEVLTGLIKSSTADVTSEACQTLKAYLGRTVVTLLSIHDIRSLKPKTPADSDLLAKKVDALLKANPEKSESPDAKQQQGSGASGRRAGSFGMANRIAPAKTVIDPSEPVIQSDVQDSVDMADLTASSECFIRFEACGFEEDERHLFLQAENNKVVHISHKAVIQLACGFLNSEHGGSIYLGISPCGTVVGMEMTWNQRDEIRQGLDMSISHLKGQVLSSMYGIKFTPVHKIYWTNGQRMQEAVKDLFVAELHFAPNHSNQLYYLKETEVFLREGKHTIEASATDIQHRQIRYLEKDRVLEEASLLAEINRLRAELQRM